MPLDNPNDAHWMSEALVLAREAAAAGEIPVGAILLSRRQGESPRILGRGFNRRESDHDPTAHAEIIALRQASQTLQSWRLLHCTLYVTLEPCPMCAGAIVQARLPRLVYGCSDPKAGAVHSLFSLCSDHRLNHQVQITAGILAVESAALLKSFFAARRG